MPKLKIIIFLFCLCFLNIKKVSSQNSEAFPLIDKSYKSLKGYFQENINDSIKAKKYANAYFEKGKKDKSIHRMIYAKYLLGRCKNNFSQFHEYCDSLISNYKKDQDFDQLLKIHSEKGHVYYESNRVQESLKEFIKVKALLKKKHNDSIHNVSQIFIADIKKSYGDYDNAIKIYKSVLHSLEKDKTCENLLLKLPKRLTLSYIELKKFDSAFYYLDKGHEFYSKYATSNQRYLQHLIFLRSKIHFEKKEYNKAIEKVNRYIKLILKDQRLLKELSASYSLLGMSFKNLKLSEKAHFYFEKVDSLYSNHQVLNNDYNVVYNYLIQESKENENLELQLHYITNLLEHKNKAKNNKTEIVKSINQGYDIPELLNEKNALINSLKKKSDKNEGYKFLFFFLVVLTVLLLIYQTKRKKVYKERFLKALDRKEKVKLNNEKQNPSENQPKQETSELSIQQEIVEDILSKLQTFELEYGFLNNELNLNNLAETLETNSNYLSKVINQYKKQSFSNYINNLRIEYVLRELKEDELLRKYTVKALALEVGFKNAESFSKAFQKKTNIRPSYFIKELNKLTA